MSTRHTRRDALRSAAVAGTLAGLGDLSFLSRLNAVAAAEARLEPGAVRLSPEIEPLVRLLETTPRDRLLEEVADRIRKGLSYRELLAALLLAGVKNVEPRPSVGFKFHAVLVVNSAHLASLASPAEHRWLPIFWALDYYKSAEAQDVKERGDWTMSAVDESAVPAAHRCRRAFSTAMDQWDVPAADAAIAGLARTQGANEIYEMLFRLGARDFRAIGHKAIFVANSFRTLQCIGWQHAEPVLRSLAYALLMHEGGNPAQRDADADRPYRRNQELARKIRPEWLDGTLDHTRLHPIPRRLAHRVERSSLRPGGRTAQSGRLAPVDLGCHLHRCGRTAHASAWDHLAARHDDDQRAALRLPDERQRPDQAPPPAAKRGLPAHVSPCDARARQRQGPNRRRSHVRSRTSERTPGSAKCSPNLASNPWPPPARRSAT